MHEAAQVLKVGRRSVEHEVGWRKVHISHHTVRTLHDSSAVAPRDGGRHKASNLPVEGRCEAMRHTDRVCLDEVGIVVSVVEALQ